MADHSNELVVVAIPAVDDYVWKVSSEPVPHLTILYLGKPAFTPTELAQVTGYIQHASSQLERFMLDVERRGELGDKKADVLFFEKRWARRLFLFRNHLLQNELISRAYHSVEQYPEWTPHLTMGYPEKPAKKDDREHSRFSFVRFDKISLWTGDSVGPTFELKDDNDMEVAMSDVVALGEEVVDELLHYGVKGMRWGVRKDRGHEGERVTTRKLAKLDAQWTKTVYSTSGAVALHNEVARRMNGGMIDKFNDDPRWKGVDIQKNPSLEKKYFEEFAKLETEVYKKAVPAVHGVNPSGSMKAVFVDDDGGGRIEIRDTKVKHAEGDTTTLVFKIKRLPNGMVSELNLAEGSAEHSDLAHYGVKGMKWGVRKAARAATPASDDAKRVGEIHTQVKTLKSTKPLSNAQLQDAINRMNLEKQYSQLSGGLDKTRTQKGLKLAAQLLGTAGKQTAQQIVNTEFNKGAKKVQDLRT